MFMIVSYPWPVPSAHVQLPGHEPSGDQPSRYELEAPRTEELVSFTRLKRIRLTGTRSALRPATCATRPAG